MSLQIWRKMEPEGDEAVCLGGRRVTTLDQARGDICMEAPLEEGGEELWRKGRAAPRKRKGRSRAFHLLVWKEQEAKQPLLWWPVQRWEVLWARGLGLGAWT